MTLGHLLGAGSCPHSILHTPHRGDPCPEVSASARGEGVQTEGAHRTLKDIEALYRFGLPGGRLNAKRRRASPHIASSRQPAIPPGNGSISRSRDPSFQRSPDTRRHRAQNRWRRRNRRDGHPHHTGLPRPHQPCPVWVERDVQHAVFAVCRPAVLTVQALVSASITSDGGLSFLNGGIGPPYRPVMTGRKGDGSPAPTLRLPTAHVGYFCEG